MDGLDLTAIGTLGTGAGGLGLLGFALVQLARVLPGAITRIAAALAAAREKREETAHLREQRRLREAETEHEEMHALRDTLADLRRRLDACEERHRDAERRTRAAEERADEALRVALRQQREIDALRREMQRRGWTPPALMPAVPGEE